jgi:hypothetical protein
MILKTPRIFSKRIIILMKKRENRNRARAKVKIILVVMMMSRLFSSLRPSIALFAILNR